MLIRTYLLPVLAAAMLMLLLVACSDGSDDQNPASPTPQPVEAVETSTPTPTAVPEPTPTPEPVPNPLEDVSAIVDPENLSWPRVVEGLNGIVSIPAKPERIITASIGHDEITLALVPRDRLVAVGGVSKDPTYSNVASMVDDTAEISRDPEGIIAQAPDVIVTSPYFGDDGVAALTRAGIPVVQTDLHNDLDQRVNDILLMGYIYGEVERALAFASELRGRYESLLELTGGPGAGPRVLAMTNYSDSIWVAGGNSTEGSVIGAAGGTNAAEVAGIDGNQNTSLEGVISMDPEIIIIPQPLEFGAEEFRQSLLSNEALSELPAIRDGRVYVVESRLFTTLSHWNMLGAEELARILWPDRFPEPITTPFSEPE